MLSRVVEATNAIGLLNDQLALREALRRGADYTPGCASHQYYNRYLLSTWGAGHNR